MFSAQCPQAARVFASRITARHPASGITARHPVLALVAIHVLGGCTALDLATRGPRDEADVRTLTVKTHPVDLPLGSGHHGMAVPVPLILEFPEEGWVHGFSFDVVDDQGEVLSGKLLHHLKVMAPDKRELLSPLMLRVIGAGRETAPIMFPTNIGYHVRRGDPLLVTAMLHNPTDREYTGVRVRIDVRYSPLGSWTPPLSIYPFSTHVTLPGEETSYDLPPGRSEKSIDVRPAIRGKILALGGHLHRYGVSLRFDDVATGRVLWETSATVAEDGEVLGVPDDRFIWSGGLVLEPDRQYRFTAVYDNPTGSAIRNGAMATLGGIFVPEDDWPSVDEDDPIYRWDRSREAGDRAHGRRHPHPGLAPASTKDSEVGSNPVVR